MKKIYLILIISFIAVSISVSVLVFINFESANNNSSGHFNYQDSVQSIPNTYLGKNVEQWQQQSHESLMDYYETQGGDSFFTELGALVVKNAMINEIKNQNIQVNDLDFRVHSGMVLTSLPPHVSFEAYVNDTDNNTYRLTGMSQRAQVSQPITITQLQFFDTSLKLPLESILSPDNTIVLHDKKNDEPRVIPRNLIVSGDKDIVINFQNDNMIPIRIQGDGNWKNSNWYGPTILPFTTGTITFDKYGVYDWHARTMPLPGSISSDHMGGGEIYIIPDDTDLLTSKEKQSIGSAILQNSKTPWAMMFTNDNGITYGFNAGIYDVLPNPDEYYEARAKQLIPFDVPIITEREK